MPPPVSILLALLLFMLIQVELCSCSSKYRMHCDAVFCSIIDEAFKNIVPMRKTVESGACVSQFGNRADEICNNALEQFSLQAPVPDDDDDDDINNIHGDNKNVEKKMSLARSKLDEENENEVIYDKKVEDIERILDAPLHVLYLKQLSILREQALATFRQSLLAEGGNEFESLVKAEENFRAGAEECTRTNCLVELSDSNSNNSGEAIAGGGGGGGGGGGWGYAKEMSQLKSNLLEIASRTRKMHEAKLMGAKQSQQAMQYLQQQQQQLQAIQAQVSGSTSPWNMGLAYRVPDTNFNLACSYQQGKANIQLSCVPDESVPLLGPNGFVHGVTPGNVGVSFNINI